MKKITIGIFMTRSDAEDAINKIHRDLRVDKDDISYIYRNTEGEIREVNTDKIATNTPAEGATTGAGAGGVVGAIAGLAAVAGVIPVVGPIFAAGPILAYLGITGTVAAGAVTGAAVGGLIGALAGWGINKKEAQEYSDMVSSGNILVAVHSDSKIDVSGIMDDYGAMNVRVYQPLV